MRTKRAERGFTLVEVMVGLGLASVVLLLTVRLMKNAMDDSATKSARAAAVKGNKELIELIKRDFKFQTSQEVSADGRSLQITRKQSYETDKVDQTYSVSFNSGCAPTSGARPGVKELLEKVYAGNNAEVFDKTPGRCISSLKCRPQEIPQLHISLNADGGKTPVYPRLEFPQIDSGSEGQPIGTAICFQNVSTKVRMTLESVYLIDRSTGAVRVVSDEALLSPSSFSNVEILPGR